MTKVSVIIPVYNVEKYLRECLDSVINQTLKDIEIICVNDGSKDDSLAILHEYEQKDSRIIVIDKKNSGAGDSRNRGLEVAKGDYIIFFDADDYMDIYTLEKLYKNATSTNSDISICMSYNFINGEHEFKKNTHAINNKLLDNKSIFSPVDIKKYIFQFCVGWPWDKLYRRNFVIDNALTYQNQHHSNDTKFVLLSLACTERISVVEDILIYHRLHNVSASNTRTKNPECFYNALIALKEGLETRDLYNVYKQSFINYCITFPIWHIVSIKDEKAKNVMIKFLKKLLLKDVNISQYDQTYFYDQNANITAIQLISRRKAPLKQIFSIQNTKDKKHKVITILGIKIKIKRRNRNA